MTRKPAAKSGEPAPSVTLPKLVVPRATARQQLEEQIAKAREIISQPINSEEEMDQAKREENKWREYTMRLLSTLFDTPSLADEFRDKTRQVFLGGRLPYDQDRDFFKRRMTNRVAEVESIVESLALVRESPEVASSQTIAPNSGSTPKNPQEDALEKIELIANRFHTIARQLRQRHGNRSTLTINDEYDVQDLFHSLLRLFFHDIRDEEWTPSYAGGASRIDFLLKQEQVLVEIKMTRPGLKAKDVSDQLIIDTDRYRVHPDCKMLVAFVYDPEGYINNPRGVEGDLSGVKNGIPVKVIIAP
jgi:hypothetical protein